MKKCQICNKNKILDSLHTVCKRCRQRLDKLIYPKKFIEKSFNIKIKDNYNFIGFDVATVTGAALINRKDKESLQFKLWTYKIDYSNDYSNVIRQVDKITKEILKQVNLQNKTQVIIEDSFLKFNPYVFKFLSRLSGIFFAKMSCFDHIDFLQANSARKNLGLSGNVKKEQVKNFIAQKLLTYIEDDNQADAIILALNGALDKKGG